MWDYDDSYDPPVFQPTIPETGPILTGDSGGGFGWPDTSDVFDVLGKVAVGVGSVAKTAFEFSQARQATQFNRQMSQAQQQLALTRAQGELTNERARIEQQGAIERLRAVTASGLNSLGQGFNTLTAPVGGNSGVLMIALAAGAFWWVTKKK